VADTTSTQNGLAGPFIVLIENEIQSELFSRDGLEDLRERAVDATDGNVSIDYYSAPALIARWIDSSTASRLNAETISGLQAAKEAAETGERCYYNRLCKALAALRDLIKQMRDEESNREEGVFADPGCRDCTSGVTPDRYHTGPCALHRAEALLRALEVRGEAALKAVRG